MMSVQCTDCKQKVKVAFYFYNEQIVTHDSVVCAGQYYEAMVNGRAICPHCGKVINEIFHKTISKESIINMAVGEQIYEDSRA